MQDAHELTKVRQNLETWLTAFNAKDLDTLFDLYDAESIYANAGASLMRGTEQIKPWYQQAFANMKGTLLHEEEAAFQDGNMAVLLGRYFFTTPASEKIAEDAHLTGRVALVYRRSEAGDWKLLLDMDNSPPDVTPADFALSSTGESSK